MAPTKAPLGTLHYIEKTVYKAQKALVAAKFNGLAVAEQKFDADKDSKKPGFIAKNPTGKVPFLETDTGVIFTSNSIARYVARVRADTALYGKCFDDEGKIDTWLEFCTHEVEVPLMSWVYPTLGLMEDDPQVTTTAKQDMKQALEALEKALKSSDYLLGDFVCLADIALVCALKEGFVRVIDPAFRKPFPKVCAWFSRCCKLPQFASVLGEVTLCEKEAKPIKCEVPVVKKAEAKPAAKKEEKPAAKEKAKAAAKPAAAKPAAAAVPAGDAEAQVKAVGDEIRVLKEKLKADGLSGKKINDHPEVKSLVEKLTALKSAAEAAPKAAPAAAPAAGGDDAVAKVQALGDKIRTLKEKLKAEGLSGKKINDHPEIKALVEELTELKKALPPGA